MCIQLLKASVPALALDRFSLGIDEGSAQSRARGGHCDGYLCSSPLLPHDAITALCSLTLTPILNLTLTLILAPNPILSPTLLFFSRLSFTVEGSVQCKVVVPVFVSLYLCLPILFSCSIHCAAVMVIPPSDSSIVTPSTLAEAEAAVAAAAAALACVFEYMYV
jgi:hypothetical protein